MQVVLHSAEPPLCRFENGIRPHRAVRNGNRAATGKRHMPLGRSSCSVRFYGSCCCEQTHPEMGFMTRRQRLQRKGWRGEVGERAVRTRSEPLGARNMTCKVFTSHETRNTAFTVHQPSGISSGANQAPAHGFHETRDTRHESRPFFRVLRPSGGEKCRLRSRSSPRPPECWHR